MQLGQNIPLLHSEWVTACFKHPFYLQVYHQEQAKTYTTYKTGNILNTKINVYFYSISI